jgi:hypothetical protein
MNENNEFPYIRVRTAIYKKIQKPLLSGDFIECLSPWSLDVIRQDYGKKWIELYEKMAKYDGFCNMPDHLNYMRSFKGFYNQYEPLSIVAQEGVFEAISTFLKHIFQEQIDIAIDYLTILFQKPTERLPILCLVSKERGTGKTTFLNLLKEIFGANMTYNNNEDFRSNFNDSWVNKLIIAVDEVLLDRKEDSEKIKNLSTAKSYKMESKGVDRTEVEFFGKFILCSNNEEDFICIDPLETRYWIRKVHPLPNSDPMMLERLKAEVPAFVYFLKTRSIASEKKSRMWFSPEELTTESLRLIKSRFRNKIETELLEIIGEIIDAFEIDEFNFTNKDAIELLRSNNIRVNRGEMKRVLDNWNLRIQDNAYNYVTYKYDTSGVVFQLPLKGRFYSINSSEIAQILLF